MTRQLWPMSAFLIGITGLYALLVFGVLLGLSRDLTVVQMLVAQVAGALALTVLGVLLTTVGVCARDNILLANYILLSAIGSTLAAFAGIAVVIVGLVSTYETALRMILLLRNAGLIGIGLSVFIGLSIIGASINRTVKDEMRRLEEEGM